MPGFTIGTQLDLGFPGTVSRGGGIMDITARPVRTSDWYAILFGDAVFLNSDSTGGTYSSTQSLVAVASTPTFANFSGIAVREVRTSLVYAPPAASGSYPWGQDCDVIRMGTVSVQVNVGTPTAGGTVYLRLALNGSISGGIIGGIEAAADGTNTIQLTNCQFTTGLIDENNVSEITLMWRNK